MAVNNTDRLDGYYLPFGGDLVISESQIWGFGPPMGPGATQSLHVAVLGIAKANAFTLPTVVANELICNRLANVLLLPVPPGFLIDRNGEIYYASLNFNLAGEALPPADVEAIVAQDAQLAAGIVLFDMWVANKDRHNGNVAYDKVSKKTQIFDHSHTLMHHGREGLQCLVDQPAIPGHCVASEIASTGSFAMWYERIQSIPDYYIRTIAADVGDARFGLSQEDAQFCAAFLIERRKSLLKLLCENHELFPKMPSHEWSALKSYGVVP